MPRGHRARAADELEMLNIEEPEAQPEVAIEPDAAVDEEEGEEYEETITISASDLVALQDTLDDMRFKIANIERDARQAQLEAEERFGTTILVTSHLRQATTSCRSISTSTVTCLIL